MLEIPRATRDKLTRYLLNADPFLWNILAARNKKKRLAELKEIGFLKNSHESSAYTYAKLNQDLLVELGIEGIIERIVVKRVEQLFDSEIRKYFRRCWEQGQTPDLKYLIKNKLYHQRTFFSVTQPEVREAFTLDPVVVGYKDPAFVFVQIETQHNFVERWTVFAGLWFEEIEPLLQ